jgi:hypothetical protein
VSALVLKISLFSLFDFVNFQAKRGRNVFNYYTYVNSNGIAARAAEPIHDYDGLTSKLSYENSQFLRNMRINA